MASHLSEVPLHSRLDALLEKFAERDDSGEEDGNSNLDYLDFVTRRAQLNTTGTDAENEANADGSETPGSGLFQLNMSDDEGDFDVPNSQLMENDKFNDEDGIGITQNARNNTQSNNQINNNGNNNKEQFASSSQDSTSSSTPSTPGENIADYSPSTPKQHKGNYDFVSEIYRDAGISPREEGNVTHSGAAATKERRKTAKQTEREIEQAAREYQQMERNYGEDIGAHTVKTRTIDSFLAGLSDGESDTESRVGLGLGLGAGAGAGAGSDGSDGSAIGTTTTTKNPIMSAKAIANAVALPGDTQLLSDQIEEARFRQLVSSPPRMPGLRSFVSKPEPKSDHPEDSDSDLEVIPETKTNRISRPVREMLKFSAGGCGTASDRKLALERSRLLKMQRQQIAARKNAKLNELKEHGLDVDDMALKIAEKRQKNSMSAQALLEQERLRADALRIQEQSEQDDDEDEDSESDLEIEGLKPKKRIMSDSEDEDDHNDEGDHDKKDDFTPTERYYLDSIPTTTAERTDTGVVDSENPHALSHGIGRTGTQYIEPLPQDALAEMLGISEGSGDNDSEADGQKHPETDAEESQRESLDILTENNQMAHVIQPDLSDLQNKDISLSQQMAEVRHRYLQAQAEQRRKEIVAQRNSEKESLEKKKLKSRFLEDQAEESDDEDGSTGYLGRNNSKNRLGAHNNGENEDEDEDDEDEDPNAELQDLVDHSKVSVKESELKRQFMEEEKRRDQRTLTKLIEGVRGGFRRQRRGEDNQFLSDDDLDFEDGDEFESYRKMIEMRRKSNLVSRNSGVAKLAGNSRAAAFLSSISEDLVSRPAQARKSSLQESLGFLRSVAERDNELHTPQPLIPQLSDVGAQHVETETSELHNNELPRINLAVRKLSTVRIPARAERGSGTYASHISAVDVGNAKTVQILQSLSRPDESRKLKKKYISPVVAPNPKRPRHLVTATPSTSKTDSLFKRNWT